MKIGFAEFLPRLTRDFGPAAAAARHEIFFSARGRSKPRQALHGLASLARDVALLCRRTGRPAARADLLVAVTLAGASGWDGLRTAVEQARRAGLTVAVVAHPRLAALAGERLRRLPHPSRRSLARAVAASRAAGGPAVGVSRLLVAASLSRAAIWQDCWERLIAASQPRAVLLHNDFDMMSAAAVRAAQGRCVSVCLQHGIPTDEFFPVTADRYLVWGESSRAAFVAAGTDPEQLVPASFGRGGAAAAPSGPPAAIAFVSQTHTPIYGIDLGPPMAALAEELTRQLGDAFSVLLHPFESAAHPYRALAARQLRRPPHSFTAGGSPALVVGYASTALIDAALGGHYVMGLDWPVAASRGAFQVAAPPWRAADAAAVIDCYRRLLADAGFRTEAAARQEAWLAATFSADLAAAEFLAVLQTRSMRELRGRGPHHEWHVIS